MATVTWKAEHFAIRSLCLSYRSNVEYIMILLFCSAQMRGRRSLSSSQCLPASQLLPCQVVSMWSRQWTQVHNDWYEHPGQSYGNSFHLWRMEHGDMVILFTFSSSSSSSSSNGGTFKLIGDNPQLGAFLGFCVILAEPRSQWLNNGPRYANARQQSCVHWRLSGGRKHVVVVGLGGQKAI